MTVTESTTTEFPACDVLGFSLDFTTASPLDIKSVLAAVKRGRRVIDYALDENTRKLKVEGTEYDVPRCIGVTDYNSSDGNYQTFKNGTEASTSLKVDASVSARYMAVSASVSASYSIDKTYRREDQWAMYSFNSDTYLASLRNYYDLLADSSLKKRVKDLRAIGDGTDEEIVREWKGFFSAWGSHVIINAAFGARFQLNVWASNSDSSVNTRFSTSVTAAFNGITAGGQFDASVTKEDQYRTFSEYMQKTVSVVGGDPEVNKLLTADPTKYDEFVKWAGTVAKDSSITNLNVTELWYLMRESGEKDVRDKASMVEDAYNWIVLHPRPYNTPIVLDIQTDWAEFNLLSPNSVIVPDTNNPYPDNTVASNTRVLWGRGGHNYEKMTIRFNVINDGSPIDFSISRGSSTKGGKPGRAEAIIERVNYLNDEITDNAWNTKWFYQKPVSSTPAAKTVGGKSNWDTVLRNYMGEIKAK